MPICERYAVHHTHASMPNRNSSQPMTSKPDMTISCARPSRRALPCVALASLLLAGCATMTDDRARAAVADLKNYDLCLAAEAGFDPQGFDLHPRVVEAAAQRVKENSIDCADHRREIIGRLVRALREERVRAEQLRIRIMPPVIVVPR